MLASKGCNDDFFEVWDGCEEQTGDALLDRVRLAYVPSRQSQETHLLATTHAEGLYLLDGALLVPVCRTCRGGLLLGGVFDNRADGGEELICCAHLGVVVEVKSKLVY